MANTIKQFGYEITKAVESDGLPFDPVVVIVLERWATTKQSKAPQLSANLISSGEIDEHIQNLKNDLDAVARRAKAALQRAREQTLAVASKRTESRKD